MARFLLPFAAVLALSAQETAPKPEAPKPAAPKPEPPKRVESPESKALTAAFAIKEPDKKIAALEQFLKDFPAGNMAQTARRELVAASVKADPASAIARVDTLAKSLGPVEKAQLYRTLAAELNAAKKQPKDAEKYAQLGLKLFTFEAFAAGEKQAAEKAKRPVPETGGLRTRYNAQLASGKQTLGDVLLANGKTGRARRQFEGALELNPSLGSVASSLADIALKAGKSKDALSYSAQAMLTRATPESRGKFDETWQKVKGSPAGKEEFLDARYKSLFPLPLHPAKYEKTAARTRRVVLGEVYTGAGCPPCVAADLAFEAILERYDRADVAVVMYHEHIPRPDPMTNTDTVTRWKWQEGRGVPTYGVDGKMMLGGGGSRDMAGQIEKNVRGAVDRALETPPAAALALKAENDGRAVRASASVSGLTKTSPDLALNILLVEKEVTYSGENGIRFHPMVVRSVASFPLKDAAAREETQVFRLDQVSAALEKHLQDFEKFDERHNKDGKFRFMEHKSSVDAKQLAVVAFVQDQKTREVLQAAWTDAPAK